MEDMVKLPTHGSYRIIIEPTKPVCGGYHRDWFFRVVYDVLAQTLCRGDDHIVSSESVIMIWRGLYNPLTAAPIISRFKWNHSLLWWRNIRCHFPYKAAQVQNGWMITSPAFPGPSMRSFHDTKTGWRWDWFASTCLIVSFATSLRLEHFSNPAKMEIMQWNDSPIPLLDSSPRVHVTVA